MKEWGRSLCDPIFVGKWYPEVSSRVLSTARKRIKTVAGPARSPGQSHRRGAAVPLLVCFSSWDKPLGLRLSRHSESEMVLWLGFHSYSERLGLYFIWCLNGSISKMSAAGSFPTKAGCGGEGGAQEEGTDSF